MNQFVDLCTESQGDFVMTVAHRMAKDIRGVEIIKMAFREALNAGYTGVDTVQVGLAIATTYGMINGYQDDVNLIEESFARWETVSIVCSVLGDGSMLMAAEHPIVLALIRGIEETGYYNFGGILRDVKKEFLFHVN